MFEREDYTDYQFRYDTLVYVSYDLQVEHDDFCRDCALGKSAKGSCLGSDSGSKGILDLVPSDTCGPRTILPWMVSGTM